MKPLQILTRNGALALICLAAIACTDESYDLSGVKDVTLLRSGVELPIGYIQVSMDSILNDVDPTLLKIKDGIYTFRKGDQIDMTSATNALSAYTPSSISNPASTKVDMLDGTNLPSVPSNVPAGTTSYNGSTTINIPSFTSSLMNPVDSILLSNTSFTMSTTTNYLGGSGLNNAITITCTPVGSVAEYYDVNTHAKISSWTVQANSSKTIGIRMLKPGSGNSLQINYSAVLNVASAGSVTILAKTMTSIKVDIAFSSVDFQTVYGKATYSSPNYTNNIDFKGFGDIIGNNSVISFYDPSIKLYAKSNLGVPIKLNVRLSSTNTASSSTPKTIPDVHLVIYPAATPNVTKTNILTIDQPNNSLATLFKNNPDKIGMVYDIATDVSTSNHFINKNVLINLTDTIEVPLRFASDMVLNKTSEMENPFKDIVQKLPDQEDMKMGFTLEATNRIPLDMKIRLNAIDSLTQATLFTAESGKIGAAAPIGTNGVATDTTCTNTELLFNASQINLLKKAKTLKIEFLVSASQTTGYVALSPTDYLKIKVAAKISDGVKIALQNEEDSH